ncbi:hypothetical protein Mp_8g01260 [Marchantia polymorpha subsp. ruderalis]|uniref:Uncharacterized protein n=1 Tax=Marchantia polymorpha TaxID=3197 RepID=A0A2R6WRB0_MARPO|nr:hypothetical protein MARPO_0064s0072 [Marchantia polymorpha]BBN18280.1 hypothetical protein Mp_8g01260 [Marchantia polymorpha subsp. ruderalis]|eukprot:PTQ36392.1 hypothetical protein MARPO_0064s0072 [Marchantia polymorpha]
MIYPPLQDTLHLLLLEPDSTFHLHFPLMQPHVHVTGIQSDYIPRHLLAVLTYRFTNLQYLTDTWNNSRSALPCTIILGGSDQIRASIREAPFHQRARGL